MFITLFHNTHQKDNLLNIYNSMLSIAFILKDITNINDLTVSLEDYFSSFKDNIDVLKSETNGNVPKMKWQNKNTYGLQHQLHFHLHFSYLMKEEAMKEC